MNKFIKKQLEQVRHVTLPPWDDSTTHLVISRTTDARVETAASAERAVSALTEGIAAGTAKEFKVGQQYRIWVEPTLIYQEPLSKWYHTIHDTWNEGQGPTEQTMWIQVMEFNFSRKMMRVRGRGVIYDSIWAGWLPVSNIKMLEELT